MTDDVRPSRFEALDDYVAIPRVNALALSPDGARLVVALSSLNADANGYRTALWEVDPAGERPARRLTRGRTGESNPMFAPDGSLLFTTSRADPDAKSDAADDVSALWLLPADGGEARPAATRPGGISALAVARDSGTLVVSSPTFPAAITVEDDARIRQQRKDDKVTAILHEAYPVRFWDADVGPAQTRLFAASVPVSADEQTIGWHDLTPAPGSAFEETSFDITPDGTQLVTAQQVLIPGGVRSRVIVIDVQTGEQRVLIEDPEADIEAPVIDPSGTRVLVQRWPFSTAETLGWPELVLLDLVGGTQRRVAAEWDCWVDGDAAWAPDGSAVFTAAFELGHRPIFRIDLAPDTSGADVVTRLTGDHGCYAAVRLAPDGESIFALRSAMDAAPAPVRLAAQGADQQPVLLHGPVAPVDLPGTAIQVQATSDDGTTVHSWLCLPEGASAQHPAPLLLWIHGGPHHSAGDWSWRWNPWLMVARGYAVLLPDFALSTGYGQAFMQRGHGRWGQAPYLDLMAATDEALRRPDLDAGRTAAMGGSFGGYMANWIAGQTDRFKGIVTHASLWDLNTFSWTTDTSHYWRRELTPEMIERNSPHRYAGRISTPMLVIHGDKDYRVPIGEGLALWARLVAHSQGEGEPMPHKFLYFPDENHWVNSPNHAKVWYETVFAFLDHTVHGKGWAVPDRLR